MKSIYRAPVVDQIQDLKRACEMAMDLMDCTLMRTVTAQDFNREGLKVGEFALCDWVVRPRFSEPTHDCCKVEHTYPVTFEQWWNSLTTCPYDPGYRYFGNSLKLDGLFTIHRDYAEALWRSMGLSSS